jgi:hypothetical protein
MSDLKDTVAAKRAELEHAPALPTSTAAFGTVDGARVLSMIGLDPRDPKAHAVVAVAERYGLDPVLGHIQIISNSRMPYVTRDGYLFIAHKSGQLDGIEVVDGPRREVNEWVAKVAVYRKDMARPFTYPGRADLSRDNGPEMALARAERRALLRAFAITLPHDVFAEDEYDRRTSETQRGPVTPRDPAPAAPYGDERSLPDQTPPSHTEPSPAPPHRATPSRTAVSPDMPMTEVNLPEDTDDDHDVFADPITAGQMKALHAGFKDIGIADRTERLAMVSGVIGHDVGSASDLNLAEATQVLNELALIKSRAADENAPQA